MKSRLSHSGAAEDVMTGCASAADIHLYVLWAAYDWLRILSAALFSIS